MKRKLLLLLLSSIAFLARGQETTIDPGQQAKSYLEGKNGSVDHATGTFHYKVPLGEIRSGSFTLPVSLDYSARGVKVDDHPGIVGYNWNLNVGGVVTRQLRGGIADETRDKGAAYHLDDHLGIPPSFTPWVNYREMDGESDVFTAVFNGRVVNFVIRYQANTYPSFSAIPLEPTDVKIKCLYANGLNISGWEITDESGTVYTFMEEEWNCNTRTGMVETNAIVDNCHVSSWYLSQVQPVGMPCINHEYYEHVDVRSLYGANILKQEYFTRTTVKYYYGRPVIERPFDFSKYREVFDRELQNVSLYFDISTSKNPASLSYLEQIQVNAFYRSFENYYQDGGYYNSIAWRIAENLKTMGILYDREGVNNVCREITRVLDEVAFEINTHNLTSYARGRALWHLDSARRVIQACRDETRQVWQNCTYQYHFQGVYTPLLKKITGENQSIEFRYNSRPFGTCLLDTVFTRVGGETVKSVCLNRDHDDLPREIVFRDKAGDPVSAFRFNYYGLSGDPLITNIYGEKTSYPQDLRFFSTDQDCIDGRRYYWSEDQNAAWRSLRCVALSNDAVIEIAYEPNTCVLLATDTWRDPSFGGIRVREIRVRDLAGGKTSKITYEYPVFGTCVYPGIGNSLRIPYVAGFSDYLEFDRLYNPGPDVHVKPGNNGIYYSHVREKHEGKGRVDYTFVVPDTSSATYNHWEIGNPLEVRYHDNEGRLRKVVCYEYDDSLALSSRVCLSQVKPCEYFVNGPELRSRYTDSLYFEDNMRDRLTPVYPVNQSYRISANYTTFLKRVTEYRFEGDTPGYPRVSPNYTSTEYDYDLSRSTLPVKITTTSGDGQQRVEIVKRALDFDDGAGGSIPLLKERNMVGLPLKVQSRVVEPDGTERLLSERVNTYGSHASGQHVAMLLTGTSEYFHEGAGTGQADSLFSFDRSLYETTTFDHTYSEWRWLPVTVERSGDRVETRYDFETGNAILEVSPSPGSGVAARDYRRFKSAFGRPAFTLSSVASIPYRLWALTPGTGSSTLTLSIIHAGGTLTRSFTTRANDLGPQAFDLDLTAVAGITGISLSSPAGEVTYIALVPATSEFKATSYNADGTVYCTFDHAGQTERHEHDAAGRVIRTYDRDGNLLKENSYNVVIQ